MSEVVQPFKIFTDSKGEPLEDGFVYIGTPGFNPEANPEPLYWDSARTEPAAQPIRTLGGYLSRNGTPARVYLASGDYSITVRDKQSRLVYTLLSLFGTATFEVGTVASMVSNQALSVGDFVRTLGYYSPGDGGGNDYEIVAAGTGTEDGGSYINLSIAGQAKGLFPGEAVKAKQFGAKGDGVTDDFTFLDNATTYAQSSGVNKNLFLNSGVYETSQTLTMSSDGFNILGSNKENSVIEATHSSGPVIRIKNGFCGVSGVTITSSATRKSGTASGNYGILVEAEDAAGKETKNCTLTDFEIKDQPSHGIALVSGFFAIVVESFRIKDNLGHGVIIDNGTLTGRSNRNRPGGINIRSGVIQDNAGHSVVAGDHNGNFNLAYRVNIDNVDTFRNALLSGVRKSAYSMWLYTESSRVSQTAMAGFDLSSVPTVGAVDVSGRGVEFKNCRYISNTGPAVNVQNYNGDSTTTRGIYFDGMVVTNPDAPLDPAIQVDSGSSQVYAKTYSTSTIDTLTTPASEVHSTLGDIQRWNGEMLASSLSTVSERSVLDDTATSYEFSGSSRGVAVISLNTGGDAAIISFRVGSLPSVAIISGSANFDSATGVLSGTTGTNGKVTVSTHTDNKLYIENRRGDTREITLTLIGIGGSGIKGSEV